LIRRTFRFLFRCKIKPLRALQYAVQVQLSQEIKGPFIASFLILLNSYTSVNFFKGIYIHPITKEIFSLNEAIHKGYVNTNENSTSNNKKQQIPHGDFGIDKKVKSIRTKFNRDGTSVLQIDIESTKPSKGIFEIDEIEEFTLNQHLEQQQERQVIDINSVNRVNQRCPSPLKIEEMEVNLKHEKATSVQEFNKVLGADLTIKRIEDVIDDGPPVVTKKHVTTSIQERKTIEKPISIKQTQSASTSMNEKLLVINDVNRPTKAVNINGQNEKFKEEIHINNHNKCNQVDLEEINRQFIEIEQKNSIKEIKTHVTHVGEVRKPTTTYVDLEYDRPQGKPTKKAFFYS
jgi:hypothetical protein